MCKEGILLILHYLIYSSDQQSTCDNNDLRRLDILRFGTWKVLVKCLNLNPVSLSFFFFAVLQKWSWYALSLRLNNSLTLINSCWLTWRRKNNPATVIRFLFQPLKCDDLRLSSVSYYSTVNLCLDSGLFVCLKTSHRVLAVNNGHFFPFFFCHVSTNKLIEAAILIEVSFCVLTLKPREKQKQPQNLLLSNNQTSVLLSGRSWLGKSVFREKKNPFIWTSHSVLLQGCSPSLTNTNTGVWYRLSSEEQQWFIQKKSAGYFSPSAAFLIICCLWNINK